MKRFLYKVLLLLSVLIVAVSIDADGDDDAVFRRRRRPHSAAVHRIQVAPSSRTSERLKEVRLSGLSEVDYNNAKNILSAQTTFQTVDGDVRNKVQENLLGNEAVPSSDNEGDGTAFNHRRQEAKSGCAAKKSEPTDNNSQQKPSKHHRLADVLYSYHLEKERTNHDSKSDELNFSMQEETTSPILKPRSQPAISAFQPVSKCDESTERCKPELVTTL